MAMGLFSRKKKIKWFINKKPGNVELLDSYVKININLPRTETIVFYKDIHEVKKGKKFVKIHTRTDEYVFTIVSDGEAIIEETYLTLLEKMGSVT